MGLLGKMKAAHALEILKQKGREIRRRSTEPTQQLVNPQPTTSGRNVLTRGGIMNLSVRDATPFLRKIGASQQDRTAKGRRAILQKYFDDHPDVDKIIL